MQSEPRTEVERTEASTSSTLLLDRLWAPQPLHLARSRQLKRNPPVGKKRHQPSKTSHDPKSVSPHQRLREFELATYPTSASDVGPDMDPLSWWKRHCADLPNWASALR